MLLLFGGPCQEMGFINTWCFLLNCFERKFVWPGPPDRHSFLKINSLISRKGTKFRWHVKIPHGGGQRKNEELRISVAKVLLKHFVQRRFQEHYSWLNPRFFFFPLLMDYKHWKPLLNRQYLDCARSLFNCHICQNPQNISEYRRQMALGGGGGARLCIPDKFGFALFLSYLLIADWWAWIIHMWGVFSLKNERKKCRD